MVPKRILSIHSMSTRLSTAWTASSSGSSGSSPRLSCRRSLRFCSSGTCCEFAAKGDYLRQYAVCAVLRAQAGRPFGSNVGDWEQVGQVCSQAGPGCSTTFPRAPRTKRSASAPSSPRVSCFNTVMPQPLVAVACVNC